MPAFDPRSAPQGDPQYVPADVPAGPNGYGYPPVGPPVPRAGPRRADPRLGWLLTASGGVALVAALLPWFVLVAPVAPDPYGSSSLPDERGGPVVLLLGVLIMSSGAWIGVRRGDLWSPILGLAASAASIFWTLLAMARATLFNAFAFDNEVTARPGAALWLNLVACVSAMALSILALTRRRPVQDSR